MAPTDSGLGWARTAMGFEAVALLALGGAGMVVAGLAPFTGHTPSLVWLFRVNGLHSALLLATGIAALVALAGRRVLVTVCLVQAIGYALLFVWGAANGGNPTSFNLNPADNALHAALIVYALAVAMGVSSGAFETGRQPRNRGSPATRHGSHTAR